MIASIVPVKRMPRHSCVFDYFVPESLQHSVRPGQLVRIPFRQTIEFGVVLSISPLADEKIDYKSIESLVYEYPLIQEQTQKLFSTISQLYATSLSTLYKTALLPLQKRKLSKTTLVEQSHNSDKQKFSESYVVYCTEDEHILLFSSLVQAHTSLILVPEVRQIETVKKLISSIGTIEIVIWHSELSPKEKFDLWLKIRNNTEPLIVLGTRSALTLPFPRLDLIVMDYEHDDQYKSYDQQPKIHTRDIVPILGAVYGSKCVYGSFSPSFESYYRIVKEKLLCTTAHKPYTGGLLFLAPLISPDQIRIIEHIPQARDTRICSISSEERLVALGHERARDAIILVQRKGFATYVICKDCGNIERSTSTGLPMIFRKDTGRLHDAYGRESRTIPTSCSNCKSTMLILGGIGSEKVASSISELFVREKITMPVFRIDDNTPDSVLRELNKDIPRVLVGTEKVLSYVRKEKTGLYLLLDFDRYLALPEYSAFEHTIHLIDECTYQLPPNSTCIIETTSGEKPLFKVFSEKDRVYRTELSVRQKLLLPPYQSMIKYTLSGITKQIALQSAEKFLSILKKTLTEAGFSATISEIYETHPGFEKGVYWHGILVKVAKKDIVQITTLIHPHLPHGCIVDINPLSSLSP